MLVGAGRSRAGSPTTIPCSTSSWARWRVRDEHQAPPAGRLARRGDDAPRCGSSNCSELAMTGLGVLSVLDEVKVCVGYVGEDGAPVRPCAVPPVGAAQGEARLRSVPGVADRDRWRAPSTTCRPMPTFVRFVEVRRRSVRVRHRGARPGADPRPEVGGARRRVGRKRACPGLGAAALAAVTEVLAAPKNAEIAQASECRGRPERPRGRARPRPPARRRPRRARRRRQAGQRRRRRGPRRGRGRVRAGADGAHLEGSKAWMKQVARDAGSRRRVATFRADGETHVRSRSSSRCAVFYVVKTDGLAEGKGVFVTDHYPDARDAVRSRLSGDAFGDAGHGGDRGDDRSRAVAAGGVQRRSRRTASPRPGLQASARVTPA